MTENELLLNRYKMIEIDKEEFLKLHKKFSQKQNSVKDDRHVSSFPQEIQLIMNFIDKTQEGREIRAINSGFFYNGTFICVNTRQLRNFISRCKSSINSSLQQLGFTSLKNKAKAHECLLSCLPILKNDQETAKQWTVRFSIKRIMNPLMIYQQICMKAQQQQKEKMKNVSSINNKQVFNVYQQQNLVRKPLVLPIINLPQQTERVIEEELKEIHSDEIEMKANENEELTIENEIIEKFIDELPELDWDFSIPNY